LNVRISPDGLFLASKSIFFCFESTQLAASAPSTAGTSTGGGAVIRKPGSAWLEGTPAMDHGMKGKFTENLAKI